MFSKLGSHISYSGRGVYFSVGGGGTIKVFGGLGENMIKDLRKKGNGIWYMIRGYGFQN